MRTKLVGKNATIQILQNLVKTDHGDSQTQAEEFKGELISTLHCMIKKKQPKAFKQPALIYLVTLQELPNDINPPDSVKAEWTPVPMLDLKRFKEEIVSDSMHSLL